MSSSSHRQLSRVTAVIGLLVLGFLSTPSIAVNFVNVFSLHHLPTPSWLADLARAPAVGGRGRLTDAQVRGQGLRAATAGDIDEAIGWYSQIGAMDPVSAAREADLLLVVGEPRTAMQVLADAHGDRLVLAWAQTELSAGHPGQLVPAVADLSLASVPVDGAVQFLVGEAYLQLGAPAAAKHAFTRSRQDNPTDPWPSIRLAQLAFAEGQPNAAQEMLRAISDGLQATDDVLLYVSQAQVDAGDAAGGQATACRGLRASPHSAGLLALLGELSPTTAQPACD